MAEQGDDPRALLVAWLCSRYPRLPTSVLRRAAEKGYAPAQGHLSMELEDDDPESYDWANVAAAQGERCALYCLAYFHAKGLHCPKDTAKSLALYRQAAELGFPGAQHQYGKARVPRDRLGEVPLVGASLASTLLFRVHILCAQVDSLVCKGRTLSNHACCRASVSAANRSSVCSAGFTGACRCRD
jgi:TPR repeat protein